ncbi:MAG TPA: sigma-70 family RNA polymerase sigma factor [Actinomycetes bacterium]|nr:sigma-70 family RNA polymerase sigma factor [Actinomycetes bacterium]
MEADRELVEAAQAGDRQAMSELVRVTHRAVYTQALRLLGNPEDAADVTQDVYLRVIRKLGSFRHEASFATWLSRVTTNVAMSTLSRRSRRLVAEGGAPPEELADPGADPADRSDALALAARLESLVQALPEGQRQVLVLRDVYGLSTEEVASTMGLSPGAVKVRLFRARERLKSQLEATERDVVPLDGRRRGRRGGRRS